VLLGRSPEERHVYLDAAGQPCRQGEAHSSVVEREPLWLSADRVALEALRIYESKVCRCGFHQSIAHNPDLSARIQEDFCPICAAMDKWERVQRKNDERAEQMLGKSAPVLAPRPADGRHTYVQIESRERGDDA